MNLGNQQPAAGPEPGPIWRLHGRSSRPAPLLALAAGPLRLLFDPANGGVRRVRLGEREVLRGIYAAVRDRNWGTTPPQLANLRSTIAPDSFTLAFDVTCRREEIDFAWRGEIVGRTDGSVRYSFDGEARSTFCRNRIGLCVLHPIRECAGAPARQRRVDGTRIEDRFPDTVEPQIFGQGRFRDLRAVAHQVTPDIWAEVEFDGDTFEMEDQRNWTDASFKIYGTPLALPFPVEIPAGTRIHQCVTLRLCGAVASPAIGRAEALDATPAAATITVSTGHRTPLPRLGLALASHGEPLTETELVRLRSLRLSHLRADLQLASPDWPATCRRAARETEQLGVELELAVHLPRDPQPDLRALQAWLRDSRAPVARILALPDGGAATDGESLKLLRAALANRSVPLGAGSDANFCELNRAAALGQLPLADADFLFWSINPQVHASDDLSIMETIEAQADIVRTARAFAGDRPLVVSPATLKPRFNAVATGPASHPAAAELPAAVDPRQLSLFAAAWTLGLLNALAGSGIASATLFETTGWRGLMEREPGSPLPARFPSAPGQVFPVFAVFRWLAGFDHVARLETGSAADLTGLALEGPDARRRILLGNLTAEPREIRLVTTERQVVGRVLHVDEPAGPGTDEMDWSGPMDQVFLPRDGALHLTLPPYAIAALDTD